jgi:nicotinamide mononucleotide transporter
MPELLFAPAFSLRGSSVTWLEAGAALLSLLTVVCNLRQLHWGWPVAVVASLMYCALFWHSRLYGNSALHLFFATVSLWGCGSGWLRPAAAAAGCRSRA